MLKLLIGVMSCQRDRGTHNAIRETWGKLSPCDVRFFMGGPQPVVFSRDEMLVDAPDDYNHVTEKSREMFKYALANGYSHILHCGRDTYMSVQRVLDLGLENVDYAGHRTAGSDEVHMVPITFCNHGWAEYTSGGAGTWLSRRAMELILASDFYHVADDLMYGTILARAGVQLMHRPEFMKWGKFLEKPTTATVHLSVRTGRYEAKWMYRAHAMSQVYGGLKI